MRYVLAIAPASPEEQVLLRSRPALEALALPLARTIRSLPGARLFIYTTEPLAQELLANLTEELAEGLVCVPLAPGECLHPLREHGALALQALVQAGLLFPHAPVILADFRNIHLSAATLLRAEAVLAAGPEACCASFAPVRDHPVQYRAPYRLHGLETLVFPEAPEAARPLLTSLGLGEQWSLTRPFFFDWRALGLWGLAQDWRVCRLSRDNSAPELRPWQGDVAALGQDAAFRRESPSLARRLIPADASDAVSAFACQSPLPLRLGRHPASKGVQWQVTDGCPGSGLLFLWPLRGACLGQRLELAFLAGPGERGGWLDLDALTGGVPDGFLACLLADAHDGPYDHVLPMDGRELWSVDPLTGRARHPDTGRFFNNRQEFPALFERDAALCAGPVQALLGPEARQRSWRVLPLAPFEAVKVRDRLGLALHTGLRPGLDGLEPGPPVPDAPCPPGTASAPVAFLELPELSAALGLGLAEEPELLGAARLALARLLWKYRQMQWLLQAQATSQALGQADAPQDDPLLRWALFARGDELASSASYRLFEAEIRAGQAAQPEPGRGLALVPGPMLPGKPLGLSSDGQERVFVCSRLPGQPGLLRAKDLRTGMVQGFGRAGVDYLSLWHDPDTRQTCALFLAQAGQPHPGLDRFDADLRLAGTAPLPAVLHGRPRLNKLCGNAANFFLLDYECRFLFALDKETLAVSGVHGFFGADMLQGYSVRGQTLCAAGFYESVATLLDLDKGGGSGEAPDDASLRRFQTRQTLLAALVDYDPASQSLYVVSRSVFPDTFAPCPHWLSRLDREGACQGSWSLGSVFASAVHVLEKSGDVLVLTLDGQLLRHGGAVSQG